MSYFPLCSHYSFFYTPKLDRFYLSLWNYSSGWTYFFFFSPSKSLYCAPPLPRSKRSCWRPKSSTWWIAAITFSSTSNCATGFLTFLIIFFFLQLTSHIYFDSPPPSTYFATYYFLPRYPGDRPLPIKQKKKPTGRQKCLEKPMNEFDSSFVLLAVIFRSDDKLTSSIQSSYYKKTGKLKDRVFLLVSTLRGELYRTAVCVIRDDVLPSRIHDRSLRLGHVRHR